jgi:hypothetical protein
MLAEALVALASTGGSALVTAMVTDGWEGVRARIARLFGQGKKKETEAALKHLDQSRTALARLSGDDLERAREEQEVIWRTRLGDLLERAPESAEELRVLVDEIQAQVIGSAGLVAQHVTGFDQAQQAVLGHGVQNVTFGGQNGTRTTG